MAQNSQSTHVEATKEIKVSMFMGLFRSVCLQRDPWISLTLRPFLHPMTKKSLPIPFNEGHMSFLAGFLLGTGKLLAFVLKVLIKNSWSL